MKYFSILLVAAMLMAWMFFSFLQLQTAIRERSWTRLISLAAGSCLAIGAIGFFGSALSAVGGLNWLPDSFEWPAGFCSGVVSTEDRYFIVPHEPSGRIQIYDSDWKFVRGWHVDGGGGALRVFVRNTNEIHVLAARKHLVYGLGGNMLSREDYSAADIASRALPGEGKAFNVPTPILLQVFSSPFYSWLVAMVGMVLIVARTKMSNRRSRFS